MVKATNAATEFTRNAESRISGVRYVDGANLTAEDGRFLVDALTGWVGADRQPLGYWRMPRGLVGSSSGAADTCGSTANKIDLLLTDVVMPQMSGPELAKLLTATRTGLKVLCMSGYTDDTIVRHGMLEKGVAYLQKPITPASLSRKGGSTRAWQARRRSLYRTEKYCTPRPFWLPRAIVTGFTREVVVTGELQGARMEPDEIALLLEHNALQVVVQS